MAQHYRTDGISYDKTKLKVRLSPHCAPPPRFSVNLGFLTPVNHTIYWKFDISCVLLVNGSVSCGCIYITKVTGDAGKSSVGHSGTE